MNADILFCAAMVLYAIGFAGYFSTLIYMNRVIREWEGAAPRGEKP